MVEGTGRALGPCSPGFLGNEISTVTNGLVLYDLEKLHAFMPRYRKVCLHFYTV